MRNRPNILATIDRLGAAERDFLDREFLAPVLRGHAVRVRVAAVACALRVTSRDFEGFGVLRPVSYVAAQVMRPSTMAERRRYLAIFPAVRLVAVRREGRRWLALPADGGDARFQIDGLVPVLLAADVQAFDLLTVRFDGAAFWFDAIDSRADPAAAAYLRERLVAMASPAKLDRPGFTAAQREAYALALTDRVDRLAETREMREERRLRDALRHAGATMRQFTDAGDAYRVAFDVDGRRHVSVIRKGDFTVQSAGVCLSGRDRDFDLASLVGVLREGAEEGRLVHWNE